MVAAAYNMAGDDYLSYADGETSDVFAFTGQYSYGDRQTWLEIDKTLQALRARDRRMLRVLDLGCGPGTWLRRVVTRAQHLGFEAIEARGMDIADGQIDRAKAAARQFGATPHVKVVFEVGNILDPFREGDGTVDLCLCLYGVLNHVLPADFSALMSGISRVTRGYFITTVRSIGSLPTIYVEGMEAARAFRQDNRYDKLDVELANGRRMSFNSHLFSAVELTSLFAKQFCIKDLRGLDLFHGRFAGDPRWNPPNATATQVLTRELDRLEQTYCREPEFIDHATHLLLVAQHPIEV
jgi:SAM-dependent methyltransferase